DVERARRTIQAIAQQAKQRSNTTNDRPVLADLGRIPEPVERDGPDTRSEASQRAAELLAKLDAQRGARQAQQTEITRDEENHRHVEREERGIER
ncbi:MAG: hypothetical protein H0T78_11415, partial [Longispora sp.]|nr:hypothetical protein [Longispora sp. (in: high G+C Gram-positive bacteria)]